MTVPVPAHLLFEYNGDGITTTFSYPVRFLADTDLVVSIVSASGVETVKALNTDYTIPAGPWPSGGNVIFGAAPASGTKVRIFRYTASFQNVDLEDKTANPAEAVELQLDRLAMVGQDVQRRAAAISVAEIDLANAVARSEAAEAAAEAEADRAEEEADRAEAAAAGVSSAPQWSFSSKTAAGMFVPDVAPAFISLEGRDAAGDMRGSVKLKKVVSEPTHPGKLQIGSGDWYEIYGDYVSPLFWGEPGGGITPDNTLFRNACETAAAIGARNVALKGRNYLFDRNVGTDDHWGGLITESGIRILGQRATLKRFDPDISTFALAYPILFVGVPDSDDAGDRVSDVEIKGVTFVGEDVRHTSQGSTLSDFRDGIHFKNTAGTEVVRCRFEKIDSAAIYYQTPYSYNYTDARNYNLTKNYRGKVWCCEFIGEPHNVTSVFRALLHAVVIAGIDGFEGASNYFEWCDDAFQGGTTYASELQDDGDTWDPTDNDYNENWSLGPVPRCGRYWSIHHNRMLNSSEHVVYLVGMDVDVSHNAIHVSADAYEYCLSDLKVHCANAVVSKNTLTGVASGLSIQQFARNMVIEGNVIKTARRSTRTITGGAIGFSTSASTDWFDARPWLDQGYIPVYNVAVIGNTVECPEDTSYSNALVDAGCRIQTDSSDANFPDGQINNLTFSGNIFRNCQRGVAYVSGALVRRVSFNGDKFLGKPFTRTGFDGSTTLGSQAAFSVQNSANGAFFYTSLDNVVIEGFESCWDSFDGSGSNLPPPYGVRGCTINYVKEIGSAEFVIPGTNLQHMFTNNVGTRVLDRTWLGVNNSLGDGTGSSNSTRRSAWMWTGSDLRFYTNDSGTYSTL